MSIINCSGSKIVISAFAFILMQSTTPGLLTFGAVGNVYATTYSIEAINTPHCPTYGNSPRDINDSGQIVGTYSDGNYNPHGFVWENGTTQELGLRIYPYGINNSGQVVGAFKTATGESHPFLWENGIMTDLGTLGGTWSCAHAINDFGQVVGESATGTGEYRAFLWENGIMTDLGTLGDTSSWVGETWAIDINDSGQIVGCCDGHGGFIWENGIITDITTLINDANLYYLQGINNLG